MLEQILDLQVITTPGISLEECNHLIKQLECAELAKAAFIKGEISLEELCDIFPLCGIDVDEYLLQVESNLLAVGML